MGNLFAYPAQSGGVFIKRTRQIRTYKPEGLFFWRGRYTTPFILCQWRSPCHSIAIRWRLHHSRANRRHLRYSLTKIRCLCHSYVIGRSLRSYVQNFHHRLLPTEINVFLFGSAKNVLSTCPKAGFTSSMTLERSEERHTELPV